jgi:hypothetical protein
MQIRNRWVGALAALVIALGVASATAQAQEKPFKVTGAGAGPDGLPLPGQAPRMHWAVGTATHLGKYYGEGSLETISAAPQADGTITGTFGSGPGGFVFHGANKKDVLATDYGRVDGNPGTFTLYPVGGGDFVAAWVAEFVVDPDRSAGKFAGVTGSWTMLAMSEPFNPFAAEPEPVYYAWKGEGTLTFPKKGKK